MTNHSARLNEAPNRKNRVLVIDDHLGIRAALTDLLSSTGYEAIAVPSVEEGLSALARQEYDIVLLDLLFPGIQGLDGLATIKSRAPDTEVIVISGNLTVNVAVACMKRGARDVMTKPLDPDLVLQVMHAAEEARRETRTAIPTGSAVERQISSPPPGLANRIESALRMANTEWDLSTHHIDVLRALVCGAANKTIAQQLGCAESTVEFHVTALLKKARVSRRSELIAKFWTAF